MLTFGLEACAEKREKKNEKRRDINRKDDAFPLIDTVSGYKVLWAELQVWQENRRGVFTHKIPL